MNIIYLSILLVSIASAEQAPPTIEQRLQAARYDLAIEQGSFTGSAAPVLRTAIADSKYVLIGEDHLTREIPQFTAAVCDAMAPLGLAAMVVETAPLAAEFVSASLGKPDRVERMAALTKKYPDTVAFLNMRQENDLVAHCAKAANRPDFRLEGLDQEFLGSAGWILDEILATHPGPLATAGIQRLQIAEKRGTAGAKETGDPSKLLLLSAAAGELAEVAAMVKRDGDPKANALFQELVESHEIYQKNAQGSSDSNAQRARLLKANFRKSARAAEGKVLVKFGDWHLYKGVNPLHHRDLGNYIAEIADGNGERSLHICVLGAKGVHRGYAGYNQPTKLEKFVLTDDADYRWLQPAIDGQVSGKWTLYDLRKLRFQNGPVDPAMERLIDGYDLLVIIPKLTPADVIEER